VVFIAAGVTSSELLTEVKGAVAGSCELCTKKADTPALGIGAGDRPRETRGFAARNGLAAGAARQRCLPLTRLPYPVSALNGNPVAELGSLRRERPEQS
jgi:hypothetical protein